MSSKLFERIGIFNIIANSFSVFCYFTPFMTDGGFSSLFVFFFYSIVGIAIPALTLAIMMVVAGIPKKLKKAYVINLSSYLPYIVWMFFVNQGYFLMA